MAKRRKAPRNADLSHIIESLRPLAERVDALHEDPANANMHDELSYSRIESSLREFGQVEALVVKGDTVKGGNGRLHAMRELGWKYAAVARVDHLSDERATALAIALNRSAEASDWNKEVLHEQLNFLKDQAGIDVAGLGFSTDDLEALEHDVMQAIESEAAAHAPVPDGNYAEQYGVIVVCEDEAHQQQVYEQLQGDGFNVKPVAT